MFVDNYQTTENIQEYWSDKVMSFYSGICWAGEEKDLH
jgi:hypothetical protein